MGSMSLLGAAGLAAVALIAWRHPRLLERQFHGGDGGGGGMAGMQPKTPEGMGLAAALRLHIEALRADGIAITSTISPGTEHLPPALETALFRVAMEALTIVRKHAHTTRAHLTLLHRGASVYLEVWDWGCGPAPSAVSAVTLPSEHIGSRDTQERGELVAGRFEVRSQQGGCTVVAVEVPATAVVSRGL
jgi:signal transduction histidine kinase